MTLQLLREGRKVQQVVYGREYMLRYVQRSTCSGMFREEYMLRYVHGGVHELCLGEYMQSCV